MKYEQGVTVGTFEVGIVMDIGGVTFPGTAHLNIPALIGEVGGGIPKTVYQGKCGGGCIINDESRAMCTDYTTSNYILAPCYVYDGHVPQGGEVVVMFVGGDVTKPLIISPL